MSVARRDDRHNDDLVREISDSFNRAVAKRPDPTGTAAVSSEASEDTAAESATPAPRFVVTGDKRDAARGKRRGG
ncbi:hypothetical protein SAMN05216266_115158 [Amycolatopsis marina]|uniref:Uncharacterized protein n=1 Tax=Amycolatopsis marina TaxID=490629 RepID=A0A1I1BQ91_9PSEU|nr:hypothetical protein [Amycolatopsis marina]SFB51826.1 hypothetical protein SAMN05216266_115158 [Amycolatopsis marina]